MPSIGPFPGGINNRSQRGRPPVSEAGAQLFARNANNVVFNRQGSAFSIHGPEKILSGSRLRDGFSCPVGAFFRDGSTVKELYIDDVGQHQARDICTGVIGERIAWTHFNNTVYFSDDRISKKIIDGSCVQWGTPAPTEAPFLSGTSALGAGQVMACYSYLLDNGQESGASPAAVSPFGRVVSNIKKSTDTRVAAIRVYMTFPAGETFFLAATVLPDVSTVTVTDNYLGSIQPQTRGKIAPPHGHLLCEHNGRIFIAKDNVVYFSDQNAHDLFSLGEEVAGDPRWAAWQFVGKITMLESVSGGLYVGCQNGTWWIPSGDPHRAERTLAEKSIPELGAVRRIDTGELVWKSSSGFIQGDLFGKVTRMNERNVSMDTSEGGTAMGAMNINGTQVVIGVPQKPVAGKLRSNDWEPNLIDGGCE